MQISKMWRKARVVALLKPGKEPTDFSPISYLLCRLFKVLERMVLYRISNVVKEKLIPEQAGFERKQIPGIAFIDLSAAYDTVNP